MTRRLPAIPPGPPGAARFLTPPPDRSRAWTNQSSRSPSPFRSSPWSSSVVVNASQSPESQRSPREAIPRLVTGPAVAVAAAATMVQRQLTGTKARCVIRWHLPVFPLPHQHFYLVGAVQSKRLATRGVACARGFPEGASHVRRELSSLRMRPGAGLLSERRVL